MEEKELIEGTKQMSEIQTISNVFLEPGKTFDSLRQKPYFLIATLILLVLSFAVSMTFFSKVDDVSLRRFFVEQNARNPQYESMPAEEREKMLQSQISFTKATPYISVIFIFIYVAFGGLIALAISKALGGDLTYIQGISLWVYSTLPVTIVFSLLNLFALYFKPSQEIDLMTDTYGVVQGNLGFLTSPRESPVFWAFLSSLDLFKIWGWSLFAIGLQRMARLSAASAWLVSATLFFLILAFSVISAFLASGL